MSSVHGNRRFRRAGTPILSGVPGRATLAAMIIVKQVGISIVFAVVTVAVAEYIFWVWNGSPL